VIVPRDAHDGRQNRLTTVAMSRIALRASVGAHLSLESEIEVNPGPHGTSVWEGQAALQIRNQLVRLTAGGASIEAGRITDPSSLDETSEHVANLGLSDPMTRYPLLIAGFNRGNGVLARYAPIDGLHLGLTFNGGNPTSTTGTVMIGGTFPPFARFYEVPWSAVGRDARNFPLDSFHALLVSPHVTWSRGALRGHASAQFFTVDTNTNTSSDDPLTGYNLRLGGRAELLDGLVSPFANVSRVVNDTVDPAAIDRLATVDYRAVVLSAGLDVRIARPSGIGIQYARVAEQTDGGEAEVRHFLNLGGSWWVAPSVAIDARYGVLLQYDAGLQTEAQHSFWLTMRGVFGGRAPIPERP
jgi:hypothetical protein